MDGWRDGLGEGWGRVLAPVLATPEAARLEERLRAACAAGELLPAPALILRALRDTPLERVRVVILGQDPYHRPGQADGRAFSVPPGVAIPPSLRNVYREVASDLGVDPPDSGDLTGWARQGVLLLNTTLTVAPGRPGAHQGLGWEPVTGAILAAVARERRRVVFLLWGRHAQDATATACDLTDHHVLVAAHPSPLSARRGFLGCRHFSRTNAILTAQGTPPIRWAP